MSDEGLSLPSNSAHAVDDCAPTERDPSRLAVGTPSRGVALSVLWWLDGEEARDERSGRAPEHEHARE